MARRVRKEPSWNPRYIAYAAYHGRSPADQLAHDKAKSDACMLPFIRWNTEKLNEWRVTVDDENTHRLMTDDAHAEYDAWLMRVSKRYGAQHASNGET